MMNKNETSVRGFAGLSIAVQSPGLTVPMPQKWAGVLQYLIYHSMMTLIMTYQSSFLSS